MAHKYKIPSYPQLIRDGGWRETKPSLAGWQTYYKRNRGNTYRIQHDAKNLRWTLLINGRAVSSGDLSGLLERASAMWR